MAHILLTILKILGIIILCVLGIIIFVLAALLFAPFKYNVNASKGERDSLGESVVKAKVTWMWIILRCIYVSENGKSNLKIKVFGVDIQRFKRKGKKKSTRKKKKSKIKQNMPDKPQQAKEKEDVAVKDISLSEEHTDASKEEEKKSIFQKLLCKIRGIKNKIISIKEKIIGIKKKVREIFNKIGYYKEELGKDENKAAIKFIWNKIKEALNHIKPRKLKGNITFGMESPDKTGQALGVVAIFYPVYGNNFALKPDFTEKCLYGNIIAKGRIRIFTLLVICIKLIRSSEFKKLRKLIGK